MDADVVDEYVDAAVCAYRCVNGGLATFCSPCIGADVLRVALTCVYGIRYLCTGGIVDVHHGDVRASGPKRARYAAAYA